MREQKGPAGGGADPTTTTTKHPQLTADPMPMAEALDSAHAVMAAAMRSTAAQVLALDLTPDDLPGYGALWTAITSVCAAGHNPDAALVLDKLATTGTENGAHGKLLRATTATAWPEQLRQYAAAALAVRYREEFAGLAVSLTAAVECAAEVEMERILSGHRRQLLNIRGRLTALRGGPRV